MSSVPAISVLMPVCNADRYVARAVESILAQTFGDFELWIIDDGSTDRSLKILQRYAAKDSRIRLTSRPNKGLVPTLNEMLSQAQGEFIARMDADDVSMPNRFALQVEFLQKHPSVLCLGSAQEWIDEAGRVLFYNHEPEHDTEIQQKLLSGRTSISHPSAMMRRSVLLQVGGYDESTFLAEDLDLWLRLGEIGQLANLGEILIQYRSHSQSVSECHQIEQNAQCYRVCERAWQRRGIDGQVMDIQMWRPVDRRSRYEYLLRYGWWFFNTRQRLAAINYGWRAVWEVPFDIDGWKLLICAIVKRLPELESQH